MKKLRDSLLPIATVASVLVLFACAAATAQTTDREAAASGSHGGIQVHGHWVIDVRHPDGTSATSPRSNLVQAAGVGGAGVKIGVLSDGVTSLASEQAAGRLSATVTVIKEKSR